MLIDNVTLIVKAGNGGNGAVSFLRNSHQPKGGPDGGNGGNGGSIYFHGSTHLTDLREFRFKKKITADDGISGKKKNLFGKNAEDKTIFVPIGTIITEIETGKVYEINNTSTSILIAKGGKGGRGNNEFKSATNQTPAYAEDGTPGEEKTLHLELKIIADIGLIGLPNAGKSSLLAALTNAHPKIGNYPFTTLEPNIGMMENYALADIPGLIEGASKGKGLGITFLKHIEKTKMLLHCIDSTDPDIEKTYTIIRNEFSGYSSDLLSKKELIIFTKVDLVDESILKQKSKIFQNKGLEVIPCSIYNPKSIDHLKHMLHKKLSA